MPDRAGRLHVVGTTLQLTDAVAQLLGALLRPPARAHPWRSEVPVGWLGGFTRGGETSPAVAVEPELVVEVLADYLHASLGFQGQEALLVFRVVRDVSDGRI